MAFFNKKDTFLWLYFITTNNVYDFIIRKIYISPDLYYKKSNSIYKSNIFSISVIILRLISNWIETYRIHQMLTKYFLYSCLYTGVFKEFVYLYINFIFLVCVWYIVVHDSAFCTFVCICVVSVCIRFLALVNLFFMFGKCGNIIQCLF